MRLKLPDNSKVLNRKFLFAISVIGLFVIFISNALGVGTPAGTIIENTATATFKDINGNPLPPISSSVKIIIAQVCGLDVSPPTGSKSGLAGSSVYYSAIITNTGNGDDTFDLATTSSNGYTSRIYFDSNGDGVLQDSERNAGSIIRTPQLPADGIYRIIITDDIPQGTEDGRTDAVTLSAKSRTGTCTDSGTYTTTVSASVLTLNKTVDITNPLPDDIITYTITYFSTGTAIVKDLIITDPIPQKTTYVAGSITLNGVAQTDAIGDDKGSLTGSSITVNVGDVTSGKTGSVTFKVKINTGVPSGTQIPNVVTGNYKNELDINQPPVIVPGTPVVVGESCGVSITAEKNKHGNPGDTMAFAFKVTNTGNMPNLFNGVVSSTAGWAWTFNVDANGNGIMDNGDYSAKDNDGDGRLDTGTLNVGETKNYIAFAKIPSGTSDETTDVTTLSAIANKGDCSAFAILNTSVSAPVLTIIKSADPSTDVIPGTVVTYTITVTNKGSGTATDIVVSDYIPLNTTYIINSVTVNGASKTDASDSDQVIVLSGSIVVNIGNLGQNGVAIITFKVKIS